MTRDRPYSDSTLDALAAARQPDSVNLADLIEDHRAMYRSDLLLHRLHEWDGETESDARAKPKTNGHVATWTGLPFTGPFRRFIDWHADKQEVGVRPSYPGRTFPWSQSFYAQWRDCRRHHPEHHDRPEWRGSLCYQLASFVIRREFSLESACLVLGVTPPRAGRTLRNALLWQEGYMDRQRQRAVMESRAAEPYKVWEPPGRYSERHDQPGLHREDCPKCRTNAA